MTKEHGCAAKLRTLDRLTAPMPVKALLRALDSHARDSESCCVRLSRLAHVIGCSPRTVSRVAACCVKSKFLTITPRTGASVYTLNWDALGITTEDDEMTTPRNDSKARQNDVPTPGQSDVPDGQDVATPRQNEVATRQADVQPRQRGDHKRTTQTHLKRKANHLGSARALMSALMETDDASPHSGPCPKFESRRIVAIIRAPLV